ncbi:MAG: xanthine dehydrogenase family protein molybdopterin-binding subunit, partial [Sphingomonadales bacterium]|nr:xanthine dehydrogenase family protein molybdopterin-binding subunit [Sphingomonadales bacterium]
EANGHYTKEFSTFPNGCHIAEVEVDKATGTVDIVNYTVVDDFGVVINPMIVAGQVHGGVMQGVGQILTETCYYDDETGQLITGSFMDYGMPRADDISMINFQLNEVPCQTNPLGVKGCGEAGTIGALPATANAVHDALKDMGVDNMHAPITPLKVWQALNAAQ